VVFNVTGNDFISSAMFNVFIISPHPIRYGQNANDIYQHATATNSANVRTPRYVITSYFDEIHPCIGFFLNDQFYGK